MRRSNLGTGPSGREDYLVLFTLVMMARTFDMSVAGHRRPHR
jgi:hypothetical protein